MLIIRDAITQIPPRHVTMKSGSADAQCEAAEETMAEMNDHAATMSSYRP